MRPGDPLPAIRAATLVVGVVWLPLIVLWGDLPHLLTFDDAYYYFSIARNIADGAGSTFDGMHETNGYHPLWMLVVSAFYAVGMDGVGAIRAVLAFQLALWVGALWLLGGVVVRVIDRWPAFAGRADRDEAARRGSLLVGGCWFLLAANPYVFKLFVNGMETGLAAVAGAALLALAVRTDGDPLRRPGLAGFLVCFAFLSRTDAAVLVAALFLWTAVRRRRIDRPVLLVGLAFAAVVLAYLASNVALVGDPMQVSGSIKRVDLDGRRLATFLACVAAAGLVLRAGLRRAVGPGPSKLPRTQAWIGATAWWAAGSLLLLAYEWGFTVEIYLWHYAPQFLWGSVTLVVALVDIYEGASVERPAGEARTRSRMVAAIVAMPLVVAAPWQLARFLDGEYRSMQLGDRAAAEWIADNLPADAVVASWDAGVIGYFAERPVVNLDGLVNSFEWLDAKEDAPEATRAFLLDAGVGYIANHGGVLDGEHPRLRFLVGLLMGEDIAADLALIHREEYVYAGTAGGVSGRRPFATYVYELRR